jgi:hypothetical protein
MNNDIQINTAKKIKENLTALLKGDIAGSHRLVGYWRNPLTHESIINFKTYTLKELSKMAIQPHITLLKEKMKLKEAKDKHNISLALAKSNWEQIDKTGFKEGNRNSFLFSKVIGMLHNGLITNNQVLTTLETINNNELDNREIKGIANSIIKYNIQPAKAEKRQQTKKIRGVFSNALWDNKIHNYQEKNKTNFERQKFGQKITSILKKEKTIKKLFDGYVKIYKNREQFTNKIISKNSNVSIRTVQKYRNEEKIEKKLKITAFKQYIYNLSKGVIAKCTPLIKEIRELINNSLKTIDFTYKKTNQSFNFKFIEDNKLIFYKKELNPIKIST